LVLPALLEAGSGVELAVWEAEQAELAAGPEVELARSGESMVALAVREAALEVSLEA
jgi:hypothetical protein